MEMNLGKLLTQEIPYHARVYPKHTPLMGVNTARELFIFYKEDVQKENDNEDGNDEYDDEEAPIAEIRRAHIIAGTEACKDYERRIYNHTQLRFGIYHDEECIRENGWAIKNFKIFHIWNISIGKKPQSHWSVKCQRETNIIEVEMNDGKKEYGTKLVDFILDTKECDKSLSVTVDDCEVNYSLFTDALRIEFEIRPYDADGNSVLNVNGHVGAYIRLGRTEHEKILFRGENKHEKSEHISASNALTLQDSTLICPRGFADFAVDVSLNGNAGKFLVKCFTRLLPRSIAIDEQHYIVGEQGYIILTVKWACICIDQGVCVCPSGSAIGDIATFQEKFNYGSSESSSEDEEDSSEDEHPVKICEENGRKRAKISRIRSSSSSQETTSTCDEEDSDSQDF